MMGKTLGLINDMDILDIRDMLQRMNFFLEDYACVRCNTIKIKTGIILCILVSRDMLGISVFRFHSYMFSSRNPAKSSQMQENPGGGDPQALLQSKKKTMQ